MNPAGNDELDAGRVSRSERLRIAYAGHRLDLLRLAALLGADDRAADDSVEDAFLALARRPWVRDPAAFLRAQVTRRCTASPERQALVERFRAGDRSLDPATARDLAARSMSVAAGPSRLEAGLRRRTVRRTRAVTAVAVIAVIAVVVAGTVIALRGHPRAAVPAAPAPMAPAVDVPAPAVGTVPLGRYGLAVLADPGVEVLDATGGRTALLSGASGGATALGTSHDGRYVAALVAPDTIELLDQQDDLVWSGPGDVAAWSPTADTVAVDGAAGLRFVTPEVRGYGISAGSSPEGTPVAIAWRPGGSMLAVGTDRELAVVTSFGDVLTSALAPAGTELEPVTWTADGAHLLVFDEPDGAVLNTYGVRVLAAAFAGGRLSLGQQIGATVPEPGWWSADGRSSVLGVLGTGHGAVEQQRVVRCDLGSGVCTTLASGGADVDPVATASGIAYLSGDGGRSGDTVMLAAADGSHAHPAAGAPPAGQVLADGDVLLLAASTGIYRYDEDRAQLLTRTDTDGAAGQDTEIVSWQPNARSSA